MFAGFSQYVWSRQMNWRPNSTKKNVISKMSGGVLFLHYISVEKCRKSGGVK